MRIVAVADIHTFEADLGPISDGDVFVPAGDLVGADRHVHQGGGVHCDHAVCLATMTTWEWEPEAMVLDSDLSATVIEVDFPSVPEPDD